ncbi:hypothetical protein [Embleya hyalina]|uniref:Uncharacterized protein n=1 Tax=Embleya hyalina TaxID=516124 RepID=A0A401YDH3_9ACTN|nr:hypothetical protein [Embleya hyalina]GCD92640.1 hypothetical protein EHYA_00279 [Embleya hyalina]
MSRIPGIRRAAVVLTAVTALTAPIALTGTAAGAEPPTADDAAGGYSFNGAGTLVSGVHRESLVVGDFLFWRVNVQAGQKLSVKGSVDIPTDFPHKQGPRFVVNLYNPLREAIPNTAAPPNQLAPGTPHLEVSSGAWTVGDGKKYENFDGTKGSFKEFKDDHYALRGPYYIQVSISGAQGPQRGVVVPITLEVSVEGVPVRHPDEPIDPDAATRTRTPAGAQSRPVADSPTHGAARTGDGDTSSTASDWGIPVGGTLAAFLVATAAGYALRRRSAAPAPVPVSPWSAHTRPPAPPQHPPARPPGSPPPAD